MPLTETTTIESETNTELHNIDNGTDLSYITDSLCMHLKHPLHSAWTLWYYENGLSKDWSKSQREVATFSTVEDFWGLYSNIRPASELRLGCDYSLFKQGIRPMWEDAQNKSGGRWLLSLDKKQRLDVDKYWLEIMLCLIGEMNEYANEICGAVVNIRSRGNKIAIWTVDCTHEDAIMEIGQTIKERLKITPRTIVYQAHKDTINKSGPGVANMYIL